jgi:hypothetical protein
MQTVDALLIRAGDRRFVLVGTTRDGWYLYPADPHPEAGPFTDRSAAIRHARALDDAYEVR